MAEGSGRMRIMLVNSGLRRGGAETQIIRLAKRLVQRGNAVSLCILTDDTPRLHGLEGSGVEMLLGPRRASWK
jgi:hypothetical protein